MKRNIKKQVEQGKKKISSRRELTVDELKELMDRSMKTHSGADLYEAICNAFYLGFILIIRIYR